MPVFGLIDRLRYMTVPPGIGWRPTLSEPMRVPAFYFAAIYGGFRDTENAILYLRKAHEERCDYLLHLHHEAAADTVRSDPRFAELVPRPNESAPSE